MNAPTYEAELAALMPYQAEALAAALANPPADGLLVLALDNEWRDAGLTEGDVIVAAAGMSTPDMDNFAGALVAESGTVELRAVRATEAGTPEPLVVQVPARLDALQPLSVSVGTPVQLRVPSTSPALDVERVSGDHERWMKVKAGGHHVGFEHHTWQRRGTELILTSEVAIDDGRQQIHMVAVNRLDVANGWLRPVESALESPLTATLCESQIDASPAGQRWQTTSEFAGEQSSSSLDLPAEALPEFVVNQLGLFLPLEVGWVHHVTPVYEGNGRVSFPGFPAALSSTSADLVTAGGEQRPAIRVEKRVLGQPQMAMWAGEDGHIVALDYGWASAEVVERDVALGDAVPDLRPRTLD